MILPALRLAYLRGWPAAASITASLEELLVGQVLLLPAELPELEREELADLLATFLDLPVLVVARPETAPAGHLCILNEPVDEEPKRVAGSALLGVWARVVGQRRLRVPQEMLALRDAVVDLLGRQYSRTERQRLASWAGQSTDSPSTALRFASGALARELADPAAGDTSVYAAGLAAVIGWLLRGLDPRVAQWILAYAVQPPQDDGRPLLPEPRRLVGTEAAILGETAALQRAFEAGLVHMLPNEPGDPLDLRRPLELLGRLEEAPIAVELAEVAAALRPHLSPEVFLVFERLLQPAPRPLGLGGPVRPRGFVGREEEIERLTTLFEPAREIRTAVLYGIDGAGKGTVAAALCERFAPRLEPIWVTFAGGPAAGWLRVASALDLEVGREPEESVASSGPVPRWVRQVHDRLRERACLLVFDDVDELSEAELPAWLPSGAGIAAVLVLSRTSQRALQRDHDAIAVVLHPLGQEESRQLLARKAPHLANAIERGEADALLRRLDGHPGAIVLTAALLERMGLAEALALVEGGQEPLGGVLQAVLKRLSDNEAEVLRALAVCAPAGAPAALPARMTGVGEEVLERLGERALIVATKGSVRLQGLVRLAVDRELEKAPQEREALERAHAEIASEMLESAQARGDIAAEDAVYGDALLALERMMTRCQQEDRAVAETLRGLASALDDYPRGNDRQRLERLVEVQRTLLTIWSKEAFPLEWARTQSSLGNTLRHLPSGDKAENLRRAIDAFRSALTVFTREALPWEWAATQNRLGNAFRSLLSGDRAGNVSQAIDAYHAALTVRTKEAFPRDWAQTQNNLGLALAVLPSGDKADNLKQAIDAYHAALTVRTKEAFPRDWAQTQTNLGYALAVLPSGDRADNLRQAIDAYRAALTVRTREVFPRDWARTQYNLGDALADFPLDNTADNLRQAIDAYRAALTVFTKDAFPHYWEGIRNRLDAALRKFEALRAANAPP